MDEQDLSNKVHISLCYVHSRYA